MYRYDEYDRTLINERVNQFRDQTHRFLKGELSEDEFLTLRLMNGLYMQIHAHMLRVNVPYGLLDSNQVRRLAHIARTYDKDYAHVSTRQNIQFNWPELKDVPDILAELAEVEMHAVQSSGNCIRNTTSDPLAGVAEDEIADPRPFGEIIRQWSTFHPEFAYLPRKFKIAISGASYDRAAVQVHDVGVYLVKNETGELGFKILAGGGLGRTPVIGKVISEFVEQSHLLTYLEAILRVYNRYGRRDNKFKARIKILVNSLGVETFTRMVNEEWEKSKDYGQQLTQAEIDRVQAQFPGPAYKTDADQDTSFEQHLTADKAFANWVKQNVKAHKMPGYRAVYVSLKFPDIAPGDITSEQMDVLADLSDQYSFGECRTTHDQNIILADVQQGDLYVLWQALTEQKLATPNIGLLTDMICCPGLDFCALANAGSIEIAKQINDKFDDLDYLHDLGEIRLKMSGCMNACGHHHVGHIGILGVDKKGLEFYQLTLGGAADNATALGDRLGRAVEKDMVADVIGDILDIYVEQRIEGEQFLETYRRIGIEPFKSRVYDKASETDRRVA